MWKKKVGEDRFKYEPPRSFQDTTLGYTNLQIYSPQSERKKKKSKNHVPFGNVEAFQYDLPIDFRDAIRRVVLDFEQIDYSVLNIESILNENLAGRFLRTQRENKLTIVMCYHGTNVKNINPIQRDGLKVPVPGSGIQVVHGSAFGVGIYLALKPQTSFAYVTSNKMLVCFAAIGNKFVTTNNGSILVITQNAQVLPAFVVQKKKKKK